MILPILALQASVVLGPTLSETDAVSLLMAAESRYCRWATPVFWENRDVTRRFTTAQDRETDLTPMFDRAHRAGLFQLLTDSNPVVPRTSNDTDLRFDRVRVFERRYRFSANGQPSDITYNVSQQVLGRSSSGVRRHDVLRVSGCTFVPDAITIVRGSVSRGDQRVSLRFSMSLRRSALSQFLNSVWSDSVPEVMPPQVRAAEFARSTSGQWQVDNINRVSFVDNPRPTGGIEGERRSQEALISRIRCSEPAHEEAIHLGVLTSDTRQRSGIDPVLNRITFDAGGSALWNGQRVERERLLQFIDYTGTLTPKPLLEVSGNTRDDRICDVIEAVYRRLRRGTGWIVMAD